MAFGKLPGDVCEEKILAHEYDEMVQDQYSQFGHLEPPADWFHQHFNPGREPARYLALKPWGFTYQVEDLSKTDQDIKSGGTQIEYKDQDPEIHATFLAECKKRGTEVSITF